jgi:Icc-related predicted phosphoesterase
MKISICSDLHLEFGDLEIQNTDNADVLILGGDILVAADFERTDSPRADRYRRFLQSCNDQFPVVFYFAGNHEGYHFDFQKVEQTICDEIKDMPNIYWQDKSWVTIPDTDSKPDVTFVAGTLWTNFRGGSKKSMDQAAWNMNDYHGVKNGPGKNFTPQDALNEFNETLEVIQFVADNFKKVVVSTHHAPTMKSLRPDEHPDDIIHEWYNSDLVEFIEAHPSIVLWSHGHTHENYDYMVGSTRVLANPRGYHNHQAIADSFQLKTITI